MLEGASPQRGLSRLLRATSSRCQHMCHTATTNFHSMCAAAHTYKHNENQQQISDIHCMLHFSYFIVSLESCSLAACATTARSIVLVGQWNGKVLLAHLMWQPFVCFRFVTVKTKAEDANYTKADLTNTNKRRGNSQTDKVKWSIKITKLL